MVGILILAMSMVGMWLAACATSDENIGTADTVTETVAVPSAETSTTSTEVATTSASVAEGPWTEVQLPSSLAGANGISVSDDALVVEDGGTDTPRLLAYLFEPGSVVELPIEGGEAGASDVENNVVVWWEGAYDEVSAAFADQHIYAYSLPEGPKVEIAGPDRSPTFPQIAGQWVTWVEAAPSEENPDEVWDVPVYGVTIDTDGRPTADPRMLAPSANAYVLGDSVWAYSVSPDYLAFEQHLAKGDVQPGTYLLDLRTNELSHVGASAWRPSVSQETLFYWSDGLRALDIASGQTSLVDADGDFPSGGPGFVVYFRAVSGDTTTWEIVVRDLRDDREQVLGSQTVPPYLSVAPSVSAKHVAFVGDDGRPHLFELRGG